MLTISKLERKELIPPTEAEKSTIFKRVLMLWMLGMVILLPMNIINLPLNMALADYWILVGLPFLWLFVIKGHYPISLSYTIATGIILFGSLASTLFAAKPSNSIIVILKEFYIFIWFVSLTAILSKLSTRDFHRFMTVWTGVVMLHGVLIIAQFLSPSLWQTISGFTRISVNYEFYRPSGLFICDTAGCANKAAYYQLLGFVPLMLAGFTKRNTVIVGIVLFLSILATGSMGATTAFLAGSTTTGVAVAVIRKRLGLLIKYVLRLTIAISFLAGVFFIILSQNQQYQEHFKSIIVGRAGRSSEGRFALWSRGLNVFTDRPISLWGIGPENFRVVDWQGKQLHNDFLAFLVERGVLSTLGLIGIAFIAMIRAVNLLLLNLKSTQRDQLVEVIFLAMIIATLVESLTHQIFHDRELWLVLALQEAMLYKRMNFVRGSKPNFHFLGKPKTEVAI